MKNMQEKLLSFLEEDTEDSMICINQFQEFIDQQDIKDKNKGFLEFLHLISKISNNHFITSKFITKIEQILLFLKKDIINILSNSVIFNIFQNNKRILLFLIEEKILYVDKFVVTKIKDDKYRNANYIDFFLPELISFYTGQPKEKVKEYSESFKINRKKGENHNYICQLIQTDSVEEFITLVTKKSISLNSTINSSIFETNSFLIKKKNQSLIEYSAFYGSIQIFKYLQLNEIELTPSIWLYAIHGNCADIIHILEENNIKPKDNNFIECFVESIKCHHINISKYIQDNLLQIESKNNLNFFTNIFKFFNFSFFPEKLDNYLFFNMFCKYDYLVLVKYIIANEKNLNVNEKLIFKLFNFSFI